jgi:5-methyltetrahydrofolate--homocysteine methyltransferase
MVSEGNGQDPRTVLAALLEFRGEKILRFCEARLGAGANPNQVLDELSAGLDEIGRGYEDPVLRRYFNSDLIVSGRNMRRAVDYIRPSLGTAGTMRGRVVIGTVQGDVHDIGKAIVTATLESHGFRVFDLGVDVSPDRFVAAVREHHPDLVSLSALLSTTAPAMTDVIRALIAAGLRDEIVVIVGGRAVTPGFAAECGADEYARDAVAALRIAQRVVDDR